EIEQLNKKYEKSQNDNNIIKDEKPEGIITIDDFTKVSLCVAKILNCEAVEKSDKLLKLILNDGIGERQVVSGIATWYKPEDLINKKVIIVSNLKPVKLRGVVSNGMILAADASKDNVKVIFIDDSIPCGAKIR
ncbi:MAG: methionine--tRNA ligase subunit beta, partial [Oscillospiraceae bacterium]